MYFFLIPISSLKDKKNYFTLYNYFPKIYLKYNKSKYNLNSEIIILKYFILIVFRVSPKSSSLIISLRSFSIFKQVIVITITGYLFSFSNHFDTYNYGISGVISHYFGNKS